MLARDTSAYKRCKELLKIVCEMTNLFPKHLRHTIGEIAVRACVKMLTCIQMVNITDGEERLKWFDRYLVYEERLRTLMETGMDIDYQKVGKGRIAVYTLLLTDVGRQMTGWKRKCQSQVSQG